MICGGGAQGFACGQAVRWVWGWDSPGGFLYMHRWELQREGQNRCMVCVCACACILYVQVK